MPYVYDENIPLVAQKLNYTQPIIKSNFQAIKELIEENHIDFNSVAGVGKHSKIDLPVQAPVPAFANDDNGLYTFLNATTGKNELYVHKQIAGVATGTGIPFTASVLSNTAASANMIGWAYLPSGILIKWCNTALLAAGVTEIDMSGVGPDFSYIFNIQLTGARAGSLRLCSISTDFNIATKKFKVYADGIGSVRSLLIGV